LARAEVGIFLNNVTKAAGVGGALIVIASTGPFGALLGTGAGVAAREHTTSKMKEYRGTPARLDSEEAGFLSSITSLFSPE
jgi:hypothetical protein